jgi:hypothetical protein
LESWQEAIKSKGKEAVYINHLTPKDLLRRRAVSPSQIKIRSKTSRQPALAEGFDSGVKGLRYVKKNVD